MKNRFYLANKKGFHFSFDAVVAVIVFIIALGTFFSVTYSPVASAPKAFQKQIAIDLLNSADESGKLSSFDSNQIGTFINQNIPQNYNYFLNIRAFDGNTFVLSSSFDVNSAPDSNSSDVVEHRRYFASVSGGVVSYYGIAKIRMWPK